MKALSDTAAKEAKAAMDEQQRTLWADAAAAHLEAKKFKRQAKATGEAGAAAQATLEAANSADLKQAAGRSEALLTEQVKKLINRARMLVHTQRREIGRARKSEKTRVIIRTKSVFPFSRNVLLLCSTNRRNWQLRAPLR